MLAICLLWLISTALSAVMTAFATHSISMGLAVFFALLSIEVSFLQHEKITNMK
jgi:hypothetical protein